MTTVSAAGCFSDAALPGVLVDLVQSDRLAAGFGANRRCARKVADQVAAGNPGRQREALPGGVGDSTRHVTS
jgi:hypothetical protein